MNGKSDALWRWMLRGMGVIGFFTLLTLFALGREVPVWWISLIGAMFGLDGLGGLLRKGGL